VLHDKEVCKSMQVQVSLPLLIKHLIPSLRPHLMISLGPSYCQRPHSKYHHSMNLESKFPIHEFWGTHLNHSATV
jgi:hypothetical protein